MTTLLRVKISSRSSSRRRAETRCRLAALRSQTLFCGETPPYITGTIGFHDAEGIAFIDNLNRDSDGARKHSPGFPKIPYF